MGNLAYVADGPSGLQVIDVSNPSAPALLGSLDTPNVAWDVEVVGSLAYVVQAGSGLLVIDVSDPAAPTVRGEFNTSGASLIHVEVLGSLVFVTGAQQRRGRRVRDIDHVETA